MRCEHYVNIAKKANIIPPTNTAESRRRRYSTLASSCNFPLQSQSHTTWNPLLVSSGFLLKQDDTALQKTEALI